MLAGLWRHSVTGTHYHVLGVARRSKDDGKVVVYVALEGIHMPGPRMCVRDLEEWEEPQMCLDGEFHPRFIYVGDELIQQEVKGPAEPPVPDLWRCGQCGTEFPISQHDVCPKCSTVALRKRVPEEPITKVIVKSVVSVGEVLKSQFKFSRTVDDALRRQK
jgi:hypothetical protein